MLGNLVASMMLQRGTGGGRFGSAVGGAALGPAAMLGRGGGQGETSAPVPAGPWGNAIQQIRQNQARPATPSLDPAWTSALQMMQQGGANPQAQPQMSLSQLLAQLLKRRQQGSVNGGGYQMQPAMMEQPQTMPQNPYQGFTPQPYRMGVL